MPLIIAIIVIIIIVKVISKRKYEELEKEILQKIRIFKLEYGDLF